MTELYDDSLSADPASDFEDSSRESDGSTEAGNLHAFEEKRKLYRLGISKEYVRGWTRQAAFREFYQNWRDGILHTNSLKLCDFKPILKNPRKGESLYIVSRPTSLQTHVSGAPPDSRSNGVLGYIRFKEQTGTIELTNFRAALTRAYLSLGCTTKRKDNGQFAGSHGEGFKLAALVMCRDGYSVRYSTTSRYWNFCFRGYEDACEFCCNISAPKEEKLNKDKKLAFLNSGTKKEQLEAHAWEDVSVQIRVRGGKLKDKISKKDFEEWTRSALELNPPSSIISTENGDVIFDKQYAGQLYLRGLLLPAGKTILNCKYGYNLHHGKINRDRESLADRNEEAQQIALIWDTAIKQSPDSAVERYAQLLRSHIPLGDVTRAEQCVTKAAACSVWTFLLSLAGKDVFYYHERNDDANDAELIRQHLQKTPVPLPGTLWRILRNFRLVRTPQEQRVHIFEHLGQSTIPSTTFAQNVVRGLKACLALDSRTKDVEPFFVQGEKLGVDVLYLQKERCLKVHVGWLNFNEIHKSIDCDVSHESDIDHSDGKAFFCDHIITTLYGMALTDILAASKDVNVTKVKRALRSLAAQKLRRMPREITIESTGERGEVIVSWTNDERGLVSKYYGDSLKIELTLHRDDTCAEKRSMLLKVTGDIENSNTIANFVADCNCPRFLVPRNGSPSRLSGLENDVKYFPMVYESAGISFCGLPPASIKANNQLPETDTFTEGLRLPTSDSVAKTLQSQSCAQCSNYLSPSVNTSKIRTKSLHVLPSVGQPLGHSSSSDASTRSSDSSNFNAEDTSTWHKSREDFNENATLSIENQKPYPTNLCMDKYIYNSARSLPILKPDRITEEWWNTINEMLKEENVAWRAWRQETLERAFLPFTCKREHIDVPVREEYLMNYSVPRLNFEFTQGQYVEVQKLGNGNSQERYVLRIHDVILLTFANGETGVYLKVTRYSYLEDVRANMGGLPVKGINSTSKKELVIHYQIFRAAGQLADSELISVASISAIRDIGDGSDIIEFMKDCPTNLDQSCYFCRYAIRSNILGSKGTLKSVATLLKRRKPPCFKVTSLTDSAVVDLSPGVIGFAEGFAKASFTIRAALGFDDTRDLTWKTRYPSGQLYKSTAEKVLTRSAEASSTTFSCEDPAVPKVFILAGQGRHFLLTQREEDNTASLRDFLACFDTLDLASMSKPRPDYLIFTISSAVFHERAVSRLTASIFKLLDMDFTVHIRKSNIMDWGLPQDHSFIILVASSFDSEIDWVPPVKATTDVTTRAKIGDFIRDLEFVNPQANRDGKIGLFSCEYKLPCPSTDWVNRFRHDSAQIPTMAHMLHNHQTGLPQRGQPILDLNLETLENLTCMGHPIRGDLLTVRELARLQGFSDEFLFHSSGFEYRQVLDAFPPPISTTIASAIRNEIYKFRRNEEVTPQAISKRPLSGSSSLAPLGSDPKRHCQ